MIYIAFALQHLQTHSFVFQLLESISAAILQCICLLNLENYFFGYPIEFFTSNIQSVSLVCCRLNDFFFRILASQNIPRIGLYHPKKRICSQRHKQNVLDMNPLNRIFPCIILCLCEHFTLHFTLFSQ